MKMETLPACILCGSPDIRASDPEARLADCQACGAVFDSPRPVPEAIVAFYSRPAQYDDWLASGPARDRLWRRRLAKMERRAKAGSLLDIGAGIGQFLFHARDRFSPVEGTEVSVSGIGMAAEKFGLVLRRGAVEAIDFGGRKFSNITLFHVLEHVPSPRETLLACHDLLESGGKIFIAVPNDIASLGAVKRRLWRRLGLSRTYGAYGLPPITFEGGMDEIHLCHFTPSVLGRFLEGMGFEVEEMSLDPFYAASGFALAKYGFIYACCSALRALTGRNVYGTIWAAAKRKA